MQHQDRGGSERLTRRWPSLAVVLVVLVGTAAAATVAASAGTSGLPQREQETIKVGLITKDVTNPFFVKMKQGATAQAKKLGAELLYAAGKNSSDNAGQITAIENMVTAGVKGILITVADAKAQNAAIAKARKAGVLVIALDSPTSPRSAVDALFATNNFNAGVLIGKYARAATKGKTVTIAMLDEHAGSSVGALRHNGFLKGFGIKNNNPQVACVGKRRRQHRRFADGDGELHPEEPDIDVVYTINEPSAVGAWTALKNAGKTQAATTIVSVDGGCAGVRNVRAASSTRPPSSTRC